VDRPAADAFAYATDPDTTSKMAIEARRARVQWVKSYAQMELGFQVSHSGHGERGRGSRRRRALQAQALLGQHPQHGGSGHMRLDRPWVAAGKAEFDSEPVALGEQAAYRGRVAALGA
jgi:hypothetical protein